MWARTHHVHRRQLACLLSEVDLHLYILHFGTHGVSSVQRLEVSFSQRFLCTSLTAIVIRSRLNVRLSEVVCFLACGYRRFNCILCGACITT